MADAWNTLNMITNIALIILTILLILEFYHVSHTFTTMGVTLPPTPQPD
jgi:hypothetical protein